MSEEAGTIKRILVPLDMNRLSESKLPVSEAQAKAFGAEVILLHVITSARPDSEMVTLPESQALTYLNSIAANLRSHGVEAHSLVRYGSPADVILNEIEAQGADLVIIGSSIRRFFSRLFLGSVAEDIVARSPCPVLLVRPQASAVEKPPAVRSFDEDAARAGPVAPRALGLRTVALSRIVGSVGRAHELDEDFRVINRDRLERQRYRRILERMEAGASLPPIALYKLGYGYYVLDGNHRVAAAKQLGQLEIEAEVTEFVPLGDPQAQRVFAERRAFERTTGLTRVGANLPGHYCRLEEMIREYAETNGHQDLAEAARTWESRVYRPVARRLRALRLGHFFPDQRTADVFVHLHEFRRQEEEREGRPIDWEDALHRFRERYQHGE